MAAHKMKDSTKLVHGVSAAIAFSQEIGKGVEDFMNGVTFSNPQGALGNILWAATGISGGGIDQNQLKNSALAKLGGYAFDKVAMWFKRRMRV